MLFGVVFQILEIGNPTVRFGDVIYPTVRIGAVFRNDNATVRFGAVFICRGRLQ